MRKLTRLSAAFVTAAVFTTSFRASAAESAELQALRQQVNALEQQLRVIARQIELKEEAAAAAAPTTPRITINDRGFTLASPDAANSIRLRGLVQFDSRVFFDDGGGILNNAFVLRRARLISEGVFAKNYSFQIVPEFGGSGVSIVDANIGVAISPALQLKFGRFKSPVGLEQLQSDAWGFFNERSIVSNLVPNRDLGIQASGDLFDARVNYAVGIFNGVADGASSNNTDFDEEKDFVGRVFATPFRESAGSPLQGLSFGVAGSYGRQKTASGRSGGYRTDGQQTFFAYNAAVIADGATWRFSPQLDFRYNSFGLLGEYVVSTVNVRPSATGAKAELQHTGWQIAAGYVLTGENSSYTGVVPLTNFNLSAGTWGAFEVVARLAEVDVDDGAFPLFASASTNASEARSLGLGLNWYLSKAVRFTFDYYQTDFGFNGAAPAVSTNPILRQDEKAFITRFQLTF
jgi:phosphate-selective porin OprO/OprP